MKYFFIQVLKQKGYSEIEIETILKEVGLE